MNTDFEYLMGYKPAYQSNTIPSSTMYDHPIIVLPALALNVSVTSVSNADY